LRVTKIIKKLLPPDVRRIKGTKINFGWGYASDPAGELTTLPDPLGGIKGAYF